ncbi:hypothetical protein MFIFM68171_02138 [Madurella fahalii]|uniref:Uncharacterized protein n=1 Tax=Madurella fahalii TaxID=1157608 RepID=A0ABQ0G2E0_9PEZI
MKFTLAAILSIAGAALVSAAPTSTVPTLPKSTGLTLPPEAIAFLEEFNAWNATKKLQPQPPPRGLDLGSRAPQATRLVVLDTYVVITDEEFWDDETHTRDQGVVTLPIGADFGQTVWHDFQACGGGEICVKVKTRFNLVTDNDLDMTILMEFYEGTEESTDPEDLNGFLYTTRQILRGVRDQFDYTVRNSVEDDDDSARVYFNVWNTIP